MNAGGTTATAAASPWIPVVAAAVGATAALVVGILTQFWTGQRENTRWFREQNDRKKQWARERKERKKQWQREDSFRWHQDRQQAYARLLTALDEWDRAIKPAMAALQTDPDTKGDKAKESMAELDRARRAAHEALGIVRFIGSTAVGELALATANAHDRYQNRRMNAQLSAGLSYKGGAYTLFKRRSELRAAMRNDLGLEADPKPEDNLEADPKARE